MATVRELLTTWGFNVDLATLDKMDAKVGGLTKGVGKVGENIDRVSKSMIGFGTRLTAFVTVPVVGLGVALANMASDAEETESKFGEVFKGLKKESNEVAEALRKDFGLGIVESKKLLGDTGELLVGFGFSKKAALEMSKQVQELSVDLASFSNVEGGATRASEAITKALIGEKEQIKSLGKSVLDEDVKKRLSLLTSQGITFESKRQAKAFATLQLIQEQSTSAEGDRARTLKSTANQIKQLTVDLKDEALALGKILLPALTELVRIARDTVFWFSQLEDATKKNIILFLGIVATIGPVVLILGILGTSLVFIVRAASLLKTAMLAAKVAMLGFQLSMLLFPALALLLGVALGVLIDDFKNFFQGNKSLLGEWIGDWADIVDDFFVLFDKIVLKVSDTMTKISDIIKNPIKEIRSLIKDTASLPGLFGLAGTALNVGTDLASGLVGSSDVLSQKARGTVNRSSTSSVRNDINISIPEGTPEQQVTRIEEAVKTVVQNETDIMLRRLSNDFPETE